MKLLKCISFFFCLSMLSVGFASCGDDDDEDNNKGDGNVSMCKSVIDGRSSEYKYAYLFLDEENNGEYEYDMYFSNLDLLYYLKQPDEISDNIIGSLFMLAFESSTVPNGNNLPVGEYASDKYDCEIELDIPIRYLIGESTDDDCPGAVWYTTWNEQNSNSSPLKISKTSDGMYKVEISEMKLKASEPGVGHIGSDDRDTSGTFNFIGVPTLVKDSDIDDYTRGITMAGSGKSNKKLVMKLERK